MAGSEKFVASPAEIEEAGAAASRIAEGLRQGLRFAGQDVDALLVQWRGEAANAYRAGWSELYDGGLKLIDTLGDLAAVYRRSSQEYSEVDEANARDLA